MSNTKDTFLIAVASAWEVAHRETLDQNADLVRRNIASNAKLSSTSAVLAAATATIEELKDDALVLKFNELQGSYARSEANQANAALRAWKAEEKVAQLEGLARKQDTLIAALRKKVDQLTVADDILEPWDIYNA
jgi:hypothetical protein